LLIGALAVTVVAFSAGRRHSAGSQSVVDSDRLAALWLDARSAFPAESDSTKESFDPSDDEITPSDDWMFEAVSPEDEVDAP
jgi:hypothetical protein